MASIPLRYGLRGFIKKIIQCFQAFFMLYFKQHQEGISMRDTQRQKLYNAEKSVFGDAMYEEVLSFAQCQTIVERIKAGQYYQSQKGYKSLKLKAGQGREKAYYRARNRMISLPPWARNMFVICHEVAHCVAHKTIGESGGHHASFCTHYANLVAEHITEFQAQELIRAYDRHGVLYQPSKLTFNLPEIKTAC